MTFFRVPEINRSLNHSQMVEYRKTGNYPGKSVKEEVKPDAPKEEAPKMETPKAPTKEEVIKQLEEKGIEFDKRLSLKKLVLLLKS